MLKIVAAAVSILVICPFAFAAEVDCDKIVKQAEKEEVSVVPAAAYKVVGQGRLYFHSAPRENCPSKDVFVIPGDGLIAYSEYKGWLSVMYMNPKTGEDYHGWVQSKRLKFTGTMGPNN